MADDPLVRIPPGKDQLDFRRLLLDQPKHVLHRNEAEVDGHVDLIEDHHVVELRKQGLSGRPHAFQALRRRLPPSAFS